MKENIYKGNIMNCNFYILNKIYLFQMTTTTNKLHFLLTFHENNFFSCPKPIKLGKLAVFDYQTSKFGHFMLC